MVAAIGGLARRGLLARGGQVVQKASEIDTVVFDKTGTLTTGAFEVVEILVAPGRTEEEVLALGATAEASSDHPLARVIVRSAEERGVAIEESQDARIVPGRGAQCVLDGRVVRAGNEAFLSDHGIEGLQRLPRRCRQRGGNACTRCERQQVRGGDPSTRHTETGSARRHPRDRGPRHPERHPAHWRPPQSGRCHGTRRRNHARRGGVAAGAEARPDQAAAGARTQGSHDRRRRQRCPGPCRGRRRSGHLGLGCRHRSRGGRRGRSQPGDRQAAQAVRGVTATRSRPSGRTSSCSPAW